MLKNTVSYSKPLKGLSSSINIEDLANLIAQNLIVAPSNVENVISGSALDGVLITNSELRNTIIGINGATLAYFTDLYVLGNSFLYGNLTVTGGSFLRNNLTVTGGTYLKNNLTVTGGTLLNGNLSVTGSSLFNGNIGINGCASVGNLSICTNTLSAINTNERVNIKDISVVNTLEYSFEYITNSVNPDTSKIITYLTIDQNSTGTLGSLNLVDGQLKKIICISCDTNVSYSLIIPDLITPNPLNGPNAIGIQFTRAGMSCELLWNDTLNKWIISGGMAYTI